MSYWQAILLGIIQGLTEFLPVSSSAHGTLAQRWMCMPDGSPPIVLFDLATDVGTLLAIVLVFYATFLRYLRRLLTELGRLPSHPNTGRPRPGLVRNVAWRILLLGVAASASTALIGIGFRSQFESAVSGPVMMGVALLLTGALLFVSGKVPRPRKPWRQLGLITALFIGLAQAFAVVPGFSRSGATICTALIGGLKRRWAAEFSFLIAFPAICGAALIKLNDVLSMPSDRLDALPTGPIFAGGLVATVVGYAALKMLLVAVRRAKLIYFSYYVWVLGALIIVLGITGRLG